MGVHLTCTANSLLTSTATSGSPFFAAPSTTAATISSKYFVNVKPSISLINASVGPISSEDLSLFIRVVCFLRDESRLPGGPIDSMLTWRTVAQRPRDETYAWHRRASTSLLCGGELLSWDILRRNQPWRTWVSCSGGRVGEVLCCSLAEIWPGAVERASLLYLFVHRMLSKTYALRKYARGNGRHH